MSEPLFVIVVIMHQVYTLSLIYILNFSVLALGFDRVDADGETVIRIQCGETQNVTSPNYPHHYQDNSMTHWYIGVDPGERIVVTFNDFQTEAVDFLSILEDNYPTAEAKYSGSIQPTPYVTLSNHLQMIFESDRSQSNKGFHLTVSCLQKVDVTGVHAAFEGLEYIRILTQPICRDDWHTNVADTVCREAGFTGSYDTYFTTYTSGFENDLEINDTIYQCSKSSFRLQDCTRSTSTCTGARKSVVIKCNLLGELGCFNLAEYSHLLAGSISLSRDQCVAHCKAYSTIPQYAVHHNGTLCSCINQTEINLTRLSQLRDRCLTNAESKTGHWATLLNVSFGCCNEPPQLHNGSWKATSNAYIFGTSISAECNDGYELVGGEEGLKCGRGTHSSSLDFEWHGSIPSCGEKNTGSRSAEDESMTGCVPSTSTSPKNTSNVNGAKEGVHIAVSVTVPIVISILIISVISGLVWYCLGRQKNVKDGDQISLWGLPRDHTDSQRQSRERSRGRGTHSQALNNVPATTAVENEYMSNVDPTMPPNSVVRSPESPTSNLTNDSPRVLNSFQSSLRVQDMMPGDPLLSESPIDPLKSSLPLLGVNETSSSLTQPLPSTCPTSHRPLPGRPISKDHTYAEPLNEIFPPAESSEPDIDVSATGVRLPRTSRKPLKPAKKLFSLLPKSGTSPSGSSDMSDVSEPRPYEEPLTTVHVSGSSDSLTSAGSSLSDGLGSTCNHDRHDYEDVNTQMDMARPECETPNSADSGLFVCDEDFDRRRLQTVRSSSCSEKKYCSIHDPQPQNDNSGVQTNQEYISRGKTASSQDPIYFTLEREGEDTTEMIDNPLYVSTED